jgi:lambda family phage portal protein
MGKRRSRQQLEDALAEAQLQIARNHLRAFEAAKQSRRTENWYATNGGPNADLRVAMSTLIRRHQDLVDNDPWAGRAIQVIQGNWIGDGIVGAPGPGGTRRYGNLWQEWSDSTACDFYGRLNFYGLQELAARTTAVRGSVLVRRRFEPSLMDQGLPPLQLQVLEPDWLDTDKDEGRRIIGGKQFDDQGRLQGFWLRHHHPGEREYSGVRIQSSFVPTEEVIHHYEVRRPGQYSGVPWGASVLLRLRDMADRDSAQLLKDKLAACYTAFVTELETPDSLSITADEIIDTLEPGAVEILPPGRDIRFAQPPTSGDYTATQLHHLHAVAVGYGISFESLTGILSEVNFSSARMGWLEFNRNIARWRWNITVPQLLDPVHGWFREMSQIMLGVRGPARMVWTPPRREMVNPKEEIGWLKDAIRAGFMSLSEVQKSFGFVPLELLDELKVDMEAARSRGLVLDVDPSQDAQRANIQAAQAP